MVLFGKACTTVRSKITASPFPLYILPSAVHSSPKMLQKHPRLSTSLGSPGPLLRMHSSVTFPFSVNGGSIPPGAQDEMSELFLDASFPSPPPHSLSCTLKTVLESNHCSPPSPPQPSPAMMLFCPYHCVSLGGGLLLGSPSSFTLFSIPSSIYWSYWLFSPLS